MIAAYGRGAARVRRRGFTLLEMLLALAVLIALTAFVLPPFASWTSDAGYAAMVSNFESAVLRARAMARSSGDAVSLRIGASGAIEVSRLRAAGDVGGPVLVMRVPERGGIDLESPATASDGPTILASFLPDGTEVSGAHVRLHWRGKVRELAHISAVDGRVTTKPPPAENAESNDHPESTDGASTPPKEDPKPAPAKGPGGAEPEEDAAAPDHGVSVLAIVPLVPVARVRRGRAGRGARAHWGTILLEMMLALALFVLGAVALTTMLRRATDGVRRARDVQTAVDIAETAMARLVTGEVTADALAGPVRPWSEGPTAETGNSFDESAAPTPWSLEVHSEPVAGTELVRVGVTAVRSDSGMRWTLWQLVRNPSSVTRAAAAGGRR